MNLANWYNGNPDDDFFWTAGVNRRINHPESYFLDIIIDRSKIFELLSKVLNYESSRIQYKKINLNQIKASVDDYNYRKKIIKKLCNQNNLKCVFLIQPHFYTTSGLNSKLDKKLKKSIETFHNSNMWSKKDRNFTWEWWYLWFD